MAVVSSVVVGLSCNERNPCLMLPLGLAETGRGHPRRKVGMTSSSCPYVQGFTHANGRYKGLRCREVKRTLGAGLSSNLVATDPVKSESLVTQHQQRRKTSRALRTHPARHVIKSVTPEASGLTLGRELSKVDRRLGRSRTKVAVPEGAAGPPSKEHTKRPNWQGQAEGFWSVVGESCVDNKAGHQHTVGS